MMRLDALVNMAFMNTMTAVSSAWNSVVAPGRDRMQGSNRRNYISYHPSQRPFNALGQPPNERIAQRMGPPPRMQASASMLPQTVNYISYVFNTNYVAVGDVNSAQVGVHVNSGSNSMNKGSFGNYGNNGNRGSHSGYSNNGSNGNHRNQPAPSLVNTHPSQRIQA